jgi:hypothetical protein
MENKENINIKDEINFNNNNNIRARSKSNTPTYQIDKIKYNTENNNNNNYNTIGTNGISSNLNFNIKSEVVVHPSKENMVCNTVRNTKELTDYVEPRSSLNSIRTNKRNETTPQETVRDTIHKLEDNEKLFNDQLVSVKEELKNTRLERDNYKRKFEESTTLQDGHKM